MPSERKAEATTQPIPEAANVAQVRCINGEPTVFEVASKSAPGRFYRVDVAAYQGAGQCSCVRWETVCWVLIRDTKHLAPSKRCRHLKAGREMALNLTIRQHLKERGELK